MAIHRYTNKFFKTIENDPEVLPTSAADFIASDFWLESLTLTNTTASPITVTIKDKQGTARSFTEALSIAANSVWSYSGPGRYFPGGLNWIASGAGIVAAVRGRVM